MPSGLPYSVQFLNLSGIVNVLYDFLSRSKFLLALGSPLFLSGWSLIESFLYCFLNASESTIDLYGNSNISYGLNGLDDVLNLV